MSIKELKFQHFDENKHNILHLPSQNIKNSKFFCELFKYHPKLYNIFKNALEVYESDLCKIIPHQMYHSELVNIYELIRACIGDIKSWVYGLDQMVYIINSIDDNSPNCAVKYHIKNKFKCKLEQYINIIDTHCNSDIIRIKDASKMNIKRNRFYARHTSYAIKYQVRSNMRNMYRLNNV